jgi:flagellar protein FliO/FliZ
MVTSLLTRHGSPNTLRRRMRPHNLIALGTLIAALALALLAPQAPAQSDTAATTAPAERTAPATTTVADPESLPIPEGSSSPVSVGGGDLGGTAIRLLLGLIVVVALILGVWYLLKRIQRGRYPALGETTTGLVSILSTTPLGPGRALHIVRVADRVVLIGATDHAVSAIAHLDDETAAVITRALGPDDGGPGAVARARAMETTGAPASMIEKIRAMTVRS